MMCELRYIQGAISLDGLDRIVVDEFHEILDSSKASWLAALQELWTESGGDKTSLWGLTGTPPLSDFASVARIAQAHARQKIHGIAF